MAVAAAAVAGAFSLYYWSLPQPEPSDFSWVWAGARDLLNGKNPYETIGPGKAWNVRHPLFYPLPALVMAFPFSLLPLRWADAGFVSLGAGALAWALTSRTQRRPQLLVFASFAYLHAAQVSQWSPLLTAGVLLPALSFVLLAKPTIGAALWIAYPSKAAAIWVIALTGTSVLIWPWWPAAWLANLGSGPHIVPPITRFGGPLILLALLRWRRPEARLLAALGCVPQSPFLYEAVPLFLIPRTGPEAAALAGLTVGVKIAWELGKPYSGYEETSAAMGQWMVYLLYLPCVVMMLLRPNVADSVDRVPVSPQGGRQSHD